MAITANYDTLLKQAPMTADDYLRAAVDSIDRRFQDGYAQQHPELVAAFMHVCANDMGVSTIVVAIQEAAARIAEALEAS